MAEVSAAVKTDDTSVRWWEPLVAFVGGNALGSVLSVVTGVGALFLLTRHGSQNVPSTLEEFLLSFPVVMGALILNNLAMLGLTGWLVQRRAGAPFAAYFPAVPISSVLLSTASGVGLSLLINGGNQLVDSAGWLHFIDTPTERAMVPHGAMQFVISLITITLLAPLTEEFIFRGLLMRWLMPFAKATGAVLVSSAVFGLIHGQFFLHPGAQGWVLTVELIATGVVLGVWAARSGSLRTSFAMHAAFNLTATTLSVIWS